MCPSLRADFGTKTRSAPGPLNAALAPFMTSIKEHLVSGLVGLVIGGLGTLVLSIYSDLLPAILPALGNVPPQIYVKVVLLLALLLLSVVALSVALYLRARPYRPRALFGKAFGFKWSAQLDYRGKRDEVDIEIQWVCPKHGVFFGIKSAEITETTYHNLWCAKCATTYEMKANGETVYVEEAVRILERRILGRLRLEEKSG